MRDSDDEAVDGRRCLELLGVWCVYLEGLFSDTDNTERSSSVVQRSRVLNMVMWSYGLNVSPHQKKRYIYMLESSSTSECKLRGNQIKMKKKPNNKTRNHQGGPYSNMADVLIKREM